MSADHKRPLFAFVFVLLVCSLIVANGLRSQALVAALRTGATRVVAGVELITDHRSSRAPQAHDLVVHRAVAQPVAQAVAHPAPAPVQPTAPAAPPPASEHVASVSHPAPGHAGGPQAHVVAGHAQVHPHQGQGNQGKGNQGHQKGHAQAHHPHGVAAGWLAHGLGHQGHRKGHDHGRHLGRLARTAVSRP